MLVLLLRRTRAMDDSSTFEADQKGAEEAHPGVGEHTSSDTGRRSHLAGRRSHLAGPYSCLIHTQMSYIGRIPKVVLNVADLRQFLFPSFLIQHTSTSCLFVTYRLLIFVQKI